MHKLSNLPWNYTPGSVIPHPPYKKMLYRAGISSYALDLCSQWSPGALCSCLRHLRPFLLYQSKIGRGYNVARGLISRDIACFFLNFVKILGILNFHLHIALIQCNFSYFFNYLYGHCKSQMTILITNWLPHYLNYFHKDKWHLMIKNNLDTTVLFYILNHMLDIYNFTLNLNFVSLPYESIERKHYILQRGKP